jgi:hypothetical protein
MHHVTLPILTSELDCTRILSAVHPQAMPMKAIHVAEAQT